MRLLALAIGVSSLALTAACQDTPHSNPARPGPESSRPAPSPTPSTNAQVAASIRAALARQGVGSLRLTTYEDRPVTSHFRVDCGATRPRAQLDQTAPGRGTQPARVHLRYITDDHELYTSLVNVPAKLGGKYWGHRTIDGLNTHDVHFARGSMVTEQDLYVANCDQPSLLAHFTRELNKLSTPGSHTCVVKVKRAAREAKGYAKDFYKFLEGIGGTKARLTVWLDKGLLPMQYQISVGDHKVQLAKWKVVFDRWHLAPINLPPKSAIK